MMEKHYTYLITNLNPTNEKYYIGVRTCRCNISEDVYFGSCSYLRDEMVKNGVGQYEKVIISEFKDRNNAMAHEIQLHEEYNVGINPLFYNRVKQTSTGFDIQGNIAIGKKISAKRLDPLWQATTGKEAFEKQRATKSNIRWKKKTGAIVSKGKTGKCLGENNANYGNTMPAESKAIISKANKGHSRNIGSKRTAEQRANISNSLKGKRWYNNGETRVYVFPIDKPAGFWPGLKLTTKDKNYE
jgi:hypothetical protein